MRINVKVKNSDKFIHEVMKELMPKNSKISVGILDRPHAIAYRGGQKSEHSKGGALQDDLTTAQIGKIHEYGLGGMPRRSFLRDTIKKWLVKDALRLVTKNYKRIDFFLKAMANTLYDRIQEAFDTNGWGEWKGLSYRYMKLTGRTLPALTDTGQLRAAIYTEYAGETKTGKKISGGHSAQRSDRGKYRQWGNTWVESLYGTRFDSMNRKVDKKYSSVASYFHKG